MLTFQVLKILRQPIVTDADIEALKHTGAFVETFTGKAGDAIIVNTQQIHEVCRLSKKAGWL